MTVRELVTVLGFKTELSGAKEYNQEIDKTKSQMEGLTSAIAKAQIVAQTAWGIMSEAAGAAVSVFTDTIFENTAQLDKYTTSIGVMMGGSVQNMKEAAELAKQVSTSSFSNIYGDKAALAGAQGLMQYNVQAKDAIAIMTKLGDVAGGDAESLALMAQNLGQIKGVGKAQMADLKQFSSRGFNVQSILAEEKVRQAHNLDVTVNVSRDPRYTAELQKQLALIDKQKVGYDEIVHALDLATSKGGLYYQYMDKVSQTLPGLLGQIQALKDSIGTDIGQGSVTMIDGTTKNIYNNMEGMKSILRFIIQQIKDAQGAIENIGGAALKKVIDGFWRVVIFFDILKYRIKEAGVSFQPLMALGRSVFDFFTSAAWALAPVMGALAVNIIAAFKPIAAFVTPIVNALKGVFADLARFAAERLGALTPLITSLTPVFTAAGNRIGFLLGKLAPILSNISKAIVAAFTPIKAFVTPLVNALSPIIFTVYHAIRQAMNGAAKDTAGFADIVRSLTPLFSAAGTFIGGIITTLWKMRDAIKVVGAVLLSGIGIWKVYQTTLGIVRGAMAAYQAVVFALKAAQGGLGALLFLSAQGNKAAALMMDILTLKTKLFAAASKIAAGVQAAFNAVMAANPVALIIIGIAALIALIVLLVKNGDKVKAAFQNALQFFALALSPVLALFKTIVSTVKTYLSAVLNVVKSVFSAIGGIIGAVVNVVKTVFGAAFNIVNSVFGTLFSVVSALFGGLVKIWRGDGNIFAKILNSIKLLFVSVWGGIFTIVKTVLSNIISIWKSIFGVFTSVLKGVGGIFGAVFNGVKAVALSVSGAVAVAWSAFAGILASIWGGIAVVAGVAWGGIQTVITGVVNGVQSAWSVLSNWFSPLWGGIVMGARAVWSGITGYFSSLIADIEGLWSGLARFFAGLWDALKEGPTAVIQYLWGAFTTLFDKLKEKFLDFIRPVMNVIRPIVAAVGGITGGIGNAVKGVAGSVAGFFTGGSNEPETADYIPDSGSGMTRAEKLTAFTRNLAAGGLQPAYAGASATPYDGYQSFPRYVAERAAAGSVNNNYQSTVNNNAASSSASINAPITINNAIHGLSETQARKVIESGVKNGLNEAINGSRGAIPSPSARRW